MGYKKYVTEKEWLYDLSYGCYQSWIETSVDDNDDIYEEEFVWPEQRLRAKENALCTEDAELLRKELLRFCKILQEVDVVSALTFDWDIVDEYIHHASHLSKNEKEAMSDILQEIKVNDFPVDLNGHLVKMDILNEVHCLINDAFDTREHRLMELFRLVIGTERRPKEVCKQKMMALEELYQMIFDDSMPRDEKKREEKKESIEGFIIRILSAIIGESLIGLPVAILVKKINDSASVQMLNYYFDFFKHLAPEVRERLTLDSECEKKAVLLEDNPTYIRYPELKETVIDNMERIELAETEIARIFWNDRYSSFVNYCSSRDWFKMNDLLRCNFKELYYAGDKFGLSKVTVNNIVSVYQSWIEGLCKKDESRDSKDNEEKINDVLGLFWG